MAAIIEGVIEETARLFARLFFLAFVCIGGPMFVGGYLFAEYRMKADPPPCKPVVIYKKAEAPSTKAQVARFVRQFHNQDAGWIR